MTDTVPIPRKIWHLLNSPERRSIMVLLVLMVIGMELEMLGVGLVIPVMTLLTQAVSLPTIQRCGARGTG